MKKVISMVKGMMVATLAAIISICATVNAFAADMSPATGDESNPILMFVLLGVAAVGIIGGVVVAIVKKNK